MTTSALIEIFRAGCHIAASGARVCMGEDDLEHTAVAYRHRERPAPLYLGHRERGTFPPAMGHVRQLIRKGASLFAEVFPKAELVDLVRAGRYKKVSASFQSGAQGIWTLHHVGFLGAVAPGVKGMRPLAFSEWPGAVSFSAPDDAAAQIAAPAPTLFVVPSGYTAAPDRVELLRLAKAYQAACPQLSFSEAVALVEAGQS